jgi:hypothetical protein
MMTPATILATLYARGARITIAPGDVLTIAPRSVLDDALRHAIRLHKLEIIAYLRASDPPPDLTRLPPPCPRCNGMIFWRAFGSPDLVCDHCRPCAMPSAASWYGAALPGDPLADLVDPDTRADLDWLQRRRPETVHELLTLERRCDALAGCPDARAFEDACRSLVEAVHRLCRQSRLMQQLPN